MICPLKAPVEKTLWICVVLICSDGSRTGKTDGQLWRPEEEIQYLKA